jgi:DnaJ homolog subfamily C member 28
MTWESEIDKKIQEALNSGSFDSLPGKGKPLSLDQNPYEDPGWRLAFHLLKSNNFSLPWIEQRRELEEQIRVSRDKLQSAWEIHQTRLSQDSVRGEATVGWDRAVVEFRLRSVEINRQILTYNLQTPSARFHVLAIRPDVEIKSVQDSWMS